MRSLRKGPNVRIEGVKLILTGLLIVGLGGFLWATSPVVVVSIVLFALPVLVALN